MGGGYLALSLATFLAFIATGFIFSLVNDFYSPRLSFQFLAAFIPASLILPLVKPRFLSLCLFVLFLLMELIQFSHIFYFKTPLNVYSLHLMWGEFKEIALASQGVLPWGLFHVFVLLCVYGILIFLYLKIQSKTSFIATILLILLLSILPYKALFKSPHIRNFVPRNDDISLLNDLKVFTAYFLIYLKTKNKDIPKYLPYELSYEKVSPRNIVLILGESVNANHIALLGYERNTTPKLKELALNDENFIAKKALSSSVLTNVSLPMFMNISYNHNDIQHILNENTHLFKLAKQAGFKTYYISNQEESLLSYMSSNFIDVLYTKENYALKSSKIGDLVLLEKLDELATLFEEGSNFIVFHQRSSHVPYKDQYKGYKQADVFPLSRDLNENIINTYDNSIIFDDYVLSRIFEKFKTMKTPTYILFVPDHGETLGELGENNKSEFHHGFLSKNVANIPIFASAYGVKKDDEFIKDLRQIFTPTHYELGVALAKLMGFKIINPNFKQGIFYINGNDLAGNNGYIEVLKQGEKLEFKTHSP